MKKNILLVPLDERPCNLEYVVELFENQNIIYPSKEILGYKKTAADKVKILDFILANATKMDAIVISMDMLYFGGLLPSRLYIDKNISVWIDEVNTKLEELKNSNPALKIYGYQLIMRTPQYDSSDEEPDYYETHGLNIFKYGVWKHKKALGLSEGEMPIVPQEYIEDYEFRRESNITSLSKSLELLEKNVFDYFVIPQDDSHEFGYTAIDQIKIKEIIKSKKLENILIYPGADEVGAALVGRAVSPDQKNAKLLDSSIDGINMIPKYEDRPQILSFEAQLKVANINIVEDNYGYVIAINTCPGKMVESWEWQENKMDTSKRDFKKFIADIKVELALNKKVVIIDTAYSNGGDPELVKELNDANLLNKIHGYFAWNTSSNTIGFALALVNASYDMTNTKLVKKHLLDDFAYQTMTRWNIYKDELDKLNLTYFDLGSSQAEVIKIERTYINDVISKYLNTLTFDFEHKHPWNRMFEIKMKVNDEKN